MYKFSTYLGLFMGVVFIALGIFIMVNPPKSQELQFVGENNILVGFLVIMYGAFRLYRSYLQWKNMQK